MEIKFTWELSYNYFNVSEWVELIKWYVQKYNINFTNKGNVFIFNNGEKTFAIEYKADTIATHHCWNIFKIAMNKLWLTV